jgi:UDP-N-acetyl-2-amino-2-deoxyglucuronate dehydrogenase
LSRSPTFAILGAAGFVAPRHIDAIHDVGGRLLAACDPHDSVGVLDKYGEPVQFFPHIEQFDRWLDRQNRTADPVDYVVVCTPNGLHDAHCRLAMRSGSDVICEKPVTLTTRNLDALSEVEAETKRHVSCILQLRHHPQVQMMRSKTSSVARVAVEYHAPRGPWYRYSWKGDPINSGGVVTNIGVHLFDVLMYCFGAAVGGPEHTSHADRSRGDVALERAVARWDLSVTGPARRTFTLDGRTIDLSDGIAKLHTESYRAILSGEGFGLADARPAIELCEGLR